MNVLMVYPMYHDTLWSFKHSLKFVSKKAGSPPLGLLAVAAMLPKDWCKKLIDKNDNELLDDDILWADIAFISVIFIHRDATDEVLQKCIKLNSKEASINLAYREQLLHRIVQAGFEAVFIGIESPNKDCLIECIKYQNTNRDIILIVKTIQDAGREVQGGFIVGFDFEQKKKKVFQLNPNYFLALFRSIIKLGVIGEERIYYLKLFIWTLFLKPQLFSLAILFMIYGFHLKKYQMDSIKI